MHIHIDIRFHIQRHKTYAYTCTCSCTYCQYIYIYTYTYTHIYTCINYTPFLRICIYLHIYIHMYMYTEINRGMSAWCMCIYLYVCMYVCMYVCTHVCMYVCMQACMHVCRYACMHVCMYVCTIYIYIYIYIYTYTYIHIHTYIYICIYIWGTASGPLYVDHKVPPLQRCRLLRPVAAAGLGWQVDGEDLQVAIPASPKLCFWQLVYLLYSIGKTLLELLCSLQNTCTRSSCYRNCTRGNALLIPAEALRSKPWKLAVRCWKPPLSLSNSLSLSLSLRLLSDVRRRQVKNERVNLQGGLVSRAGPYSYWQIW